MIKNSESRWKSGSMTEKESFDSFYRRKLDALNIELKNVINGSVPFVVSQEYACLACHRRVKIHKDGSFYCLSCQKPCHWSKATVESVDAILERYPQMEECVQEWEASGHKNPAQHPPLLPRTKQGDEKLGRQIKEARLKLNMTTHELAARITKVKGGRLTERAIRGYEGGNARPSQNVMEQLKSILGLEV